MLNTQRKQESPINKTLMYKFFVFLIFTRYSGSREKSVFKVILPSLPSLSILKKHCLLSPDTNPGQMLIIPNKNPKARKKIFLNLRLNFFFLAIFTDKKI